LHKLKPGGGQHSPPIKNKTMDYVEITRERFISELTEYYKSPSDFHRLKATAYESLLQDFGYTETEIKSCIDIARSAATSQNKITS